MDIPHYPRHVIHIRMDHLDWALTRSFLAVAETGSLTGAARRLGLSQPTLSRHITELESALGPLFHRQPRGLAPNEAALALSAAILRISNPASAGVRASKIFFSKSGIGMSPLLILSEVALPQRLLHMVRAASWVMKALGVPRWLSQ